MALAGSTQSGCASRPATGSEVAEEAGGIGEEGVSGDARKALATTSFEPSAEGTSRKTCVSSVEVEAGETGETVADWICGLAVGGRWLCGLTVAIDAGESVSRYTVETCSSLDVVVVAEGTDRGADCGNQDVSVCTGEAVRLEVVFEACRLL